MEELDINNILIYAVPSRWEKQENLQGWDFKMRSHHDNYKMFEHMQFLEQVYKGGKYSKKPTVHVTTISVMVGNVRE